MFRPLIVCILMGLSLGQLSCADVPIEQIFLDVNQQQIINLKPYFGAKSKILLPKNESLPESYGYIQDGQVKLSKGISYSFDQLIDYVVMDDDFLYSIIRVALLGRVGDKYHVLVVDFPKYSSSPFSPKTIASFQLFDGDKSPNDKACYSLDFMHPLQVIVDCSYEENPLVMQNVFFYLSYDSTITSVKKQDNLNVIQVHSVEKRKIRVVNQVLVRGHIQVNPTHQNQTYIEIFQFKDEEFMLKDIVDQAFISHLNPTIEWQVLDFQVTEFDLAVLTNHEFVMFPNHLSSSIQELEVVALPCANISSFALEENEDYKIYASCQKQTYSYAESLMWEDFYLGDNDVTSLYTSTDCILINNQKQTIIADIEDGRDMVVQDKPGCFLIATDLQNQVIEICTKEKTITQAEILNEAIVLRPRVVTKQPVLFNIYSDDHVQVTCVASYELNVIAGNHLINVVRNHQSETHELNSNEFILASDKQYLYYSDFVVGPDVTFVKAQIKQNSVFVQTIDRKFYPLTAFNLTLTDDINILKIHQISPARVQVFLQDRDNIHIFECLISQLNGHDVNNVTCTAYSKLLIPCKNLVSFQSALSGNMTTIGIQLKSERLFYSLERITASQGTLKKIESNIVGSQWILRNGFLVTYDEGISDFYIYDLWDSSLAENLVMNQQQFFELLDVNITLPWCIAASDDTIFITTTSGIIQLSAGEIDWVISDVLITKNDVNSFLFCYVFDDQLYFGSEKNVYIYQAVPQIYFRGQLNLYNFTTVSAFASDNYLYIVSNNSVLQYNTQTDSSLTSSLERVLDIKDTKQLIVCSIDSYELLYTSFNIKKAGIFLLANEKKLMISFSTQSNTFLRKLNLTATFTNHFNQTIRVQKAEQIINGKGYVHALNKKNQTMNVTLKSNTSTGQIKEFYFIPEDIFGGPLINLSIISSHQQISLMNRVHQVKTAILNNLTDLTFYRNGKKIEALIITLNMVVAYDADLINKNKTFTLDIEKDSKLSNIYYDEDSQTIHLISEDSQKRPLSIFYGSLASGLDQLKFSQIHLKQDWQTVIKHLCVGPYTLILYQFNQQIFLKVLKAYKDNARELFTTKLNSFITNITEITDFDAHITSSGLHVLLLDAQNGVSILEYTGSLRGRLLQILKVKQFKIKKDLIMYHNQAFFLDTKFNGIHTLKGLNDNEKLIRAFITTNNALQYQLNFDTSGETFSFVSSFMRLGDYQTVPQQVVYIPEQNSISLVYTSGEQIWATFYNLTNAHKTDDAVPYYQAILVGSQIGGQYVKTVGSVANTFTSEEALNLVDRANFEAKEWPLQGGVIFTNQTQNSQLILNQIQDKPGILIKDQNLSGQIQTTLQAQGLVSKVNVPLNLYISGGDTANGKSTITPRYPQYQDNQKLTFKDYLTDEVISYLLMIGGFLAFIILFCLVRCIRRAILMRKIKPHPEDMQEFSSENL